MRVRTEFQLAAFAFACVLAAGAPLQAAPEAPAGGAPSGSAPHAPASTPAQPVPQSKQGDLGNENVKGVNRQSLKIDKFDPPAAFNLEDVQNFPEDRLLPVLNNPLTFEEGRDFATMMSFQDDQLVHPWLAELSKAPFLNMKVDIDKPAKDWIFSIIDQAGGTVSRQEGHGAPPNNIIWNGDDNVHDHVAVDTVYIPQLATTDKEGYHHTYMGQPVQFASTVYRDHDKMVIELSSKRLFQEKKSELTKEAPMLLDKVCDAIREDARLPFAIQPYDSDTALARQRQDVLAKYFSEKLYVPKDQIILSAPAAAEKRGAAMAIISNASGGGAAQ